MKPHLKARELILKMCIDQNIEDIHQGYESCTPKNEYYKQCALIAVDELINDSISNLNVNSHKYWEVVKQEIEKL